MRDDFISSHWLSPLTQNSKTSHTNHWSIRECPSVRLTLYNKLKLKTSKSTRKITRNEHNTHRKRREKKLYRISPRRVDGAAREHRRNQTPSTTQRLYMDVVGDDDDDEGDGSFWGHNSVPLNTHTAVLVGSCVRSFITRHSNNNKTAATNREKKRPHPRRKRNNKHSEHERATERKTREQKKKTIRKPSTAKKCHNTLMNTRNSFRVRVCVTPWPIRYLIFQLEMYGGRRERAVSLAHS